MKYHYDFKMFSMLMIILNLFIVMAKLNFQHHCSGLQYHTIFQKSFEYADLVLKKTFLFLF